MNVWKCKLIFPNDTLQQKIEITDLKPFLTGENTSGLKLLHSTVYRVEKVKKNIQVVSQMNDFQDSVVVGSVVFGGLF